MTTHVLPRTETVKTKKLVPYANNPKTHPPEQVDKIAASIAEFGFLVPIVIDAGHTIIAGHGRYQAAQKLELAEVPCIRAEHLTEAQIKAFRLADNKLAESPWDYDMLKLELEGLGTMDFNLDLTGFQVEDDTPPDVEFPEFDESAEKDVEYLECPECGHRWPK